MKKLALVFPGQGSQKVGMLNAWLPDYPWIQSLFEKASIILGYDLWEIVSQGPEEKINQTYYTQPAMLVADLAVWQIWQQERGIIPAYVAGHSLGEYAALTVAGVLEFNDAVRVVAKRAQFMQEAVKPGEGAMAAVLGLSVEQIGQICLEASPQREVSAANLNCPGQIVIAGTTEAVERAIELAKAAGAARAMKLPMSVPSHCALMRPAAEKLRIELDQIVFNSPNIPVINNADVARLMSAQEIKEALVRQLFSPVRWIETIESMASHGVQTIVECGPGKVLTGLNKRINSQIELYSLNAKSDLSLVFEQLC